jgi:hypothetical protein
MPFRFIQKPQSFSSIPKSPLLIHNHTKYNSQTVHFQSN